MKIVFLDIDGVLNHASTRELFQGCIGIDEGNLQNFAEFYRLASSKEETKVVLTSTWREEKNREGNEVTNGYQYICDRLASVEIELYDCTPFLPKEENWYSARGAEIEAWLSEHKELGITGYVILDDVLFPDFLNLGLSKRQVRTSWNSAKGGFQKKHTAKALVVLRLPYWEPKKE